MAAGTPSTVDDPLGEAPLGIRATDMVGGFRAWRSAGLPVRQFA